MYVIRRYGLWYRDPRDHFDSAKGVMWVKKLSKATAYLTMKEVNEIIRDMSVYEIIDLEKAEVEEVMCT